GMRYLYDTGYRWEPVGSVKGHVFKDLNGDGEPQSGEPGLKGLGVKISSDRDTLTDDNGYYEFKSVSGRKAVVRFDTAKLPYGFVLTGPSEREVKIENKVSAVVNFGLVPRSQIAGVVFSDLDRDGKYDPSDKLIPKAKILIEDGRTVRSNHMGAYVFSDVIAGEHTVTLDLTSLPKGYLPSDRPVKKITLFEGIRYELPFALRAERVATGRVFEDANKNRFLDPGESGIAGITVKFGDKTSVTDKDGWYLFDDCPSGRYEITIDPASLPEGFTAPEPRILQFAADPATLSDVNLGVQRTQAPSPSVPASETL
ncbi:MAG TPA: SdrD B-like domain-containing protein, partial [Candidatus Omnitrophota bacterium]|nr:SdrD B-like domain-containing protein [Candidatus Omnitrophota bacterium]